MSKTISILFALLLISFQAVFAQQVNLNNDISIQPLKSGSDVFETVYHFWKKENTGEESFFNTKVKIMDNYLILLGANLIFENSDPSNPELIGSFNVEALTDENVDRKYLSAETLLDDSGYKSYLWLYDYSGLPNTVKRKKLLNDELKDWNDPGRYIVIDDDYLIISNHEHKIKIYDISDIFNPVLKSSYKDETRFFEDIKVEGDYLYALSSLKWLHKNKRISIFKIKDLNKIIKVSDYDFEDYQGNALDVRWGFLYIADAFEKLIILDARNPNSIKEAGRYISDSDQIGDEIGRVIKVVGNYVFSPVNFGFSAGVNILSVEDFNNIFQIEKISTGRYEDTGVKHFIVNGDLLYISSFSASGGRFSGPVFGLLLDIYKSTNLDLTEPSPNANLKTFKSKVKGNKILLRWKTDSETGVRDIFVIKKIYRKKDSVSAQNAGKTFRTLKRTKIYPKGSPSAGASYKFSDRKVKTGKTYKYVIKYRDFDGKVHALKKIKVPFN